MIVALSTFYGNAQDAFAVGFCFINKIFNTIFFRYYAAFFSIFMIAKKTCSQYLLFSGIRQHIPGNLPGNKLVVRHVIIKCVDEPVSPWPLCADVIILVAIRICI